MKNPRAIWIPHLQDAEGADFVLPDGRKGYFYLTGFSGWVLYVEGKCILEGYSIEGICDWLRENEAIRVDK